MGGRGHGTTQANHIEHPYTWITPRVSSLLGTESIPSTLSVSTVHNAGSRPSSCWLCWEPGHTIHIIKRSAWLWASPHTPTLVWNNKWKSHQNRIDSLSQSTQLDMRKPFQNGGGGRDGSLTWGPWPSTTSHCAAQKRLRWHLLLNKGNIAPVGFDHNIKEGSPGNAANPVLLLLWMNRRLRNYMYLSKTL